MVCLHIFGRYVWISPKILWQCLAESDIKCQMFECTYHHIHLCHSIQDMLDPKSGIVTILRDGHRCTACSALQETSIEGATCPGWIRGEYPGGGLPHKGLTMTTSCQSKVNRHGIIFSTTQYNNFQTKIAFNSKGLFKYYVTNFFLGGGRFKPKYYSWLIFLKRGGVGEV